MTSPATRSLRNTSGISGANLDACLQYLDNRITANGGGGGLTIEQVQDAVAAMCVAGQHMQITYDDAAGTLTFVSSASTGGGGNQATWGEILGTLTDQLDLVAALATKEPTITAGTGSQFWTGSKTWGDFAATVRATVLTGLSTASAALVTASDSVLSALGKLQAQVALKADSLAAVLTRPSINGYKEAVTVANSGTSYTFDITQSANFLITMTGNCTFTMPAAEVGRTLVVKLVQDSTGSRVPTFPSIKWPGGVTPTWTTTALKGDRVAFTCFDGTNWEGLVAGQAI